MHRLIRATFIFVISVCAAAAAVANAAPGDLDTSFGTGGKVVTMFSSSTGGTRFATPEAMIIQPDGKIIAAGIARNLLNGGQQVGAALVRYNTDGSLDASFGNGGKVHLKVAILDTIHALALQPDGKIIATGLTDLSGGGDNNFAFLVMRFNPNGSLDTSFNGSGYVINDWTTKLDEAVATAVQPDGKILAGGFVNAGTASDFAMARYNPNGSLDTTFGNGGLVRTDFSGTIDGAHTLVLLPSGKIILGGAVWNDAAATGDVALIGYNSDGSIDTGFGNGGKVLTDFGSASENTFDLELTHDNKLILVGCVGQPGLWNIAAVRYHADGSLDTTFDGDGRFTHNYPGDIEGGVAVKTQQNGKIVIAGDVQPDNGAFDFAVLRLHPNGSIDTSFGEGGRKFVDFGTFRPTGGFSNDSLTDMWIQPDGKIVVVGDIELEPNMTHDFGLARFIGDAVTNQRKAAFDYDGDNKADISIFRPSAGAWHISRSSNNSYSGTTFGQQGDLLTPADFDGDGKTDLSVFRNGVWYWLNSSDGSFNDYQFGTAGDIPVPADYTGDGRAELAVYRAGVWYLFNLANHQVESVPFGNPSDRPVPADFDGDGKTDVAAYRDGIWYYLRSSDKGFRSVEFGLSLDHTVVGDYDGDGQADPAVYRAGTWYILRSTQGFLAASFGQAGDIPVAADYDGDGKTDMGVYRDGGWYLLRSAQGFSAVQFGAVSDRPVPAAFMP